MEQEKANIPEFIRTNDGTNRIKNLEEIRSIVRELNSTDLFILHDKLNFEYYEYWTFLLKIEKEIDDELAIGYHQIGSELRKKKISVRKMLEITGQMDRAYEFEKELQDERDIAIEVEYNIGKATFGTIKENYKEIYGTYRVYAEEIGRRWRRIKKIKRIIMTTTVALVGIFIMSKSESVDRFIKSAGEKIHQILGHQ